MLPFRTSNFMLFSSSDAIVLETAAGGGRRLGFTSTWRLPCSFLPPVLFFSAARRRYLPFLLPPPAALFLRHGTSFGGAHCFPASSVDRDTTALCIEL
ncbi:unnamed protein product [Victoria cruziana]